MTTPETSTSESYFVSRLAERARRDEIAAPCTIDSLVGQLDAYLPPKQSELVRRAHAYAAEAHDGQLRRTGHPYITHPLAVAAILAEMRMDHQTIMAALLHDVIEDTEVAKSSLGGCFGRPVAELVDGVSKLAAMFGSQEEAQAENFQKMALAMAKDIRVIMVKIADRLHNMRTIGVLTREQRRRIAQETLDYYAPIANRLGMHNIRVELEDLGFAALHPLRAEYIRKAVEQVRGRRKALLEELHQSIQAALDAEGLKASVASREKHLHSIYSKMKIRHKSFREIMDVFGFRIVVAQEDDCYRALGIVHSLYKPVAGRFKDYIAIPKVNGYQSLHTTLLGMHGVPIEVQIRTAHMAEVADHGIAGHWLYKAQEEQTQGGQRTRRWVRDLLELQQRAGDPLEFIESLKIDLFPDDVYVFTPQGDIMELPRGACAVDFAYAVHTDIGNRCIACRIDRALAPLSQQLQSGQWVEIITGRAARPSPDWLSFAVSGKARSAIRQSLKNQHRAQSTDLGRKLLNRSLANAGLSIKDLDFRRLRRVFKEFGVRKLDEVLQAIGRGDLMAYAVAQRLLAADNPDYRAVPVEHEGPVAIHEDEGLVVTYGRCCGPVPGDVIVGHLSQGKGLVVHAEACRNLADVRRRNPEQIIPARWAETKGQEFGTALRIEVNRKKGVIAELAATIAAANAGVDRINVEERDARVSAVLVEVGVADRDHLAHVMGRLRRIPNVLKMARSHR